MKKIDILIGKKIAHRGLWNKINPENSFGAYRRCVDKKIPIELDVHILKDNTLLVIHDDNTLRMTGKNIVLKDAVYNDVKDLKLGNTDYKIPIFSDVLELVNGKVLLDIELKYDVKGFKICREICKYLDGYRGDFIIKSFNPIYVLWFKIRRPNYMRGILISGLGNGIKRKLLNSVWFSFILWFNIFMKVDFIVYDYRELPNRKLDKLRKSGIPVLLFTLKEDDIINYKYDGYIYEK